MGIHPQTLIKIHGAYENRAIHSSGSGRRSRRSRDFRLGLDSRGLGGDGAWDSSFGLGVNPAVLLVLVLGMRSRSVAWGFVSIACFLLLLF